MHQPFTQELHTCISQLVLAYVQDFQVLVGAESRADSLAASSGEPTLPNPARQK